MSEYRTEYKDNQVIRLIQYGFVEGRLLLFNLIFYDKFISLVNRLSLLFIWTLEKCLIQFPIEFS